MSQQDNLYQRPNSPFWYVCITPPARFLQLAPELKLRAVRRSSKQTDRRKAKIFREALAAKLYKQWELQVQQHIASEEQSSVLPQPSISVTGLSSAELSVEHINSLLAMRAETWLYSDDDDRDNGIDENALAEHNAHARLAIANYRQVVIQGPAASTWPCVAEEALDWAENCGHLIDVVQDKLATRYVREFAKQELDFQEKIFKINSGDEVELKIDYLIGREQLAASLPNSVGENISYDFDKLFQKYEEVNITKKHKTIQQEVSTIKDFLKYLDYKPLHLIEKEDIFNYFKFKLDCGWSNERVTKHGRNSLHNFFATAVNFTKLKSNPLDGMTIFPKKSKEANKETKNPRFPFKTNHLNCIFSSDWYYKNEIFVGKLSTDTASRYFIPLIGLLHGNRVSEITQLTIYNIKVISGIPCFSFEVDDIPKELKHSNPYVKLISFKNESTRRTVPIHPKLIELGFMDYFKSLKNNPDAIFIFESSYPEKLTPSAKLGRSYEQKFLRFTRDQLLFNNKYGLGNGYGNHSFRHQLEDRIIACQRPGNLWPSGISQHYTGRKTFRCHNQDIPGSEINYGEGCPPQILLEYINQINFEDIKLPPKYPVWLNSINKR